MLVIAGIDYGWAVWCNTGVLSGHFCGEATEPEGKAFDLTCVPTLNYCRERCPKA